MSAQLLAVVTDTINPVRLVAKYRPPMAVVVLTRRPEVARQCNALYGCLPLLVPGGASSLSTQQVTDMVVAFARQRGLARFKTG